MNLEFPYQIVTFLTGEPSVGETVYYGKNGWYPQIALKRRFALKDISEEEFIDLLKKFMSRQALGEVVTGHLIKPERMPVRVIDVENQADIMRFHSNLLDTLAEQITSRYPDRDGDNYYAHITAEHKDQLVIAVEQFENKTFALDNVWLLKDVTDANSVAYAKVL